MHTVCVLSESSAAEAQGRKRLAAPSQHQQPGTALARLCHSGKGNGHCLPALPALGRVAHADADAVGTRPGGCVVCNKPILDRDRLVREEVGLQKGHINVTRLPRPDGLSNVSGACRRREGGFLKDASWY